MELGVIMSYSTQIYNLEFGVSNSTTISTGEKGRKVVPINGTLVGWSIIADPAATASVALWKANAATPTISDKITGVTPPSITAGEFTQSTSFAGWSTTAVVKGDVIALEVVTNDLATYIVVNLSIRVN